MTTKATRSKKAKRPQEEAAVETPPVSLQWKLASITAILVLTAFIYANSLNNDFIYFDDPELVTENFSIRELTWDNVVYYFTTPVQFTYLPVGLISYAIDYQLGGLDPFIYHLNSLIIHLVNVALVFWLFQLMTKRFYVAIGVALLFAVHPVNVDSVAWVATRNNLLATLFFLGALLFYTYYIERGFKTGVLVLALICFTLSVLSKSASVVLPLILLLWDYYYDRKWDDRLWLEKLPFLLVALIFGVQTLTIRTDVVPPVDYTLIDRFFIFCYSLLDYLYRLIFPFQLSMSYAYPEKDGVFLPAYIYLSPIILGFIVWGLYRLKISRKVLTVGLLFFVINIFLSQSVLLIDNFKASRYAYLSYIGLFFIVADVTEQIRVASEGVQSRIKYLWAGALVIAVVGFSVLTYNRNFVWRDTVTLFDDVISKQPNIAWVYANRGIAKYRNYDEAGALDDINHALQLDPKFPLALYYRGVLRFNANEIDLALADLDTTVMLVPDFANAYNERARVKMLLQDYDGAMVDFSQAIVLDEFFSEAYFNRGVLKGDLGDYEGAVADYSSAIFYFPDYADAYYMRGLAKFNLNDLAGSCNDAATAQTLGNAQASEHLAQYCAS